MTQTIKPIEAVSGSPSYTAASFDDLFEAILAAALQYDPTSQGVLRSNPYGYNTLAVTGTTSPVAVDSGCAWVKGKLFTSSASENVAIPTPSGDTRIDRIVLRLDFTASPQTCTIQRLAGTEGSGTPPSLTQTDGTTWEISLAQVSITTGGIITVTDERVYVGDAGIVLAMLADGLLSADATGRAKMADGFITADKVADGAVTTAKIADANVTADKIAANAVETAKVIDGAITADKLASDAVTNAKIADGAVNTAELVNDAVTADKLAHDINATGIGFNADKVDSYDAADLLAGGVISGAIIMWYGALGGSDGHRPIVNGSPNEDWHLCNGETVNGYATPDMRDRFPIGAGSSYSKGDIGGATTIDIAHTHPVGTLTAASTPLSSHVHSNNFNTGAESSSLTINNGSGTAYGVATEDHWHLVSGNSGAPTTLPTHSHPLSGSTASALSSAQSILPPYRALYFIEKVG